LLMMLLYNGRLIILFFNTGHTLKALATKTKRLSANNTVQIGWRPTKLPILNATPPPGLSRGRHGPAERALVV
jgi:hypothetical protein